MDFSNFNDDHYQGGGGGIRSSSGYDENNNRRTRRITNSSSAPNINTTTTIDRNKSHGNDGGSIKIQNAPLIVTHYFQWWQLKKDIDYYRYIRTLTTITLSVTDGAEYGSFFKSIALADTTINNILVSQLLSDFDEDTYGLGQSSNKTTLYHELSVRNGYIFVEIEFDKPLVSGYDTTIEIEYDMSEGELIDSCRANSDSYPSAGSLGNVNCKEEFSAPWANQWKIPVNDVTYRFTHNQITPEILSDKAKQWKDSSCRIRRDGSKSAEFICSELDEASSKVIPAFRWYLNESGPYCSSTCGGGGTSDTIIIVAAAVGGTIALICILLGLRRVSGAAQRRRREQTRQDSRTTAVAGATSPQETALNYASQSASFSYTDAKVRQLPLLPFGANDSQVADAVQAYELESSAQRDSLDDNNAGISGGINHPNRFHQHRMEGAVQAYELESSAQRDSLDDNNAGISGGINHPTRFHQQQIAFSACESCSICISDFTIGEMVRLLPQCGHAFHSECVRKWLVDQKSAYCPLCQARVFI
jgi:hypothetical protein